MGVRLAGSTGWTRFWKRKKEGGREGGRERTFGVLLLPFPTDGVLVAKDEVHLWRQGGREGGKACEIESRREEGTEGGREGRREGRRTYLVGAPALVRPKHNHVGGLIVQHIGGRHSALAEQLHISTTTLQGLLHLHLVLEDEVLREGGEGGRGKW